MLSAIAASSLSLSVGGVGKKVFIDGEAGTTGLQVLGRLQSRTDIELLTLPADKRKDAAARQEAINEADAVILCLPDAAAIEAVALCAPDNDRTVFIDASTAHRTNPDWVYGFAEMRPGQREAIASSTRIANPGCYPTGFIAATNPLVSAGLLKKEARLVASAVSGYSGGGKPLMEVYEGGEPHEPWGMAASTSTISTCLRCASTRGSKSRPSSCRPSAASPREWSSPSRSTLTT